MDTGYCKGGYAVDDCPCREQDVRPDDPEFGCEGEEE